MTIFYYSDHYEVNLPQRHRFPMSKYRMLRERLLQNHILDSTQLLPANIASAQLAMLAHDHEYVREVINLSLEHKKARRIGLPLTREMVNRTLVSLDASYQAANKAFERGISGALSSGTHHAGFAHGEGFCFFNDFAVIAKKYRDKRILIIDLDVHQGNGNGEILNDDDHVTILDFYCEQNYPFRKNLSGHTVALQKGTQDDEYLSLLEKNLNQLDENYDLILYQAGVDIFIDDHLGLLSITEGGIKNRDRMVFNFAKRTGIPISFVIGGGYCQQIAKTVDCNFNTFLVAKEIYSF